MGDRIQAIVAYVLLVGTVAWLSWFVSNEFDQAAEDRCAVANVQVGLTGTTLTIIEGLAAADAPEDDLLTETIISTNALILESALELDDVCNLFTETERAENQKALDTFNELLTEE